MMTTTTMGERERMVPLDKIKVEVFVRRALDEEHVSTLEELIHAGTQLPPIVVTEKTLSVIDGRHRLQAYKQLGHETLRVQTVPEMGSRSEHLAAAMKANVGGSLPPKLRDVYLVAQQMLEDGSSQRAIVEHFAYFPRKFVERSISYAVSNRRKKLAQQAARLITGENLTVKQAAARMKIDADDVKDVLQKQAQYDEALQKLIAGIIHAGRSTSRTTSNAMAEAHRLQSEGIITKDEALDVVRRVIASHKRQLRTAEQYRLRISADQE